MTWKYAWKEFRKDFFMNIIVMLQMTVMLIAGAAAVTSVVTRYQYFAPLADTLSQQGEVVSMAGDMPSTVHYQSSDELAAALEGDAHVSSSYRLFGAGSDEPFAWYGVYDDLLWELYQPPLLEGEAVYSSDSGAAQILVPKNSGYQVGEIIECYFPYTYFVPPHTVTMQVSGVFDDTATLLLYNKHYAAFQDFRLCFQTSEDMQVELMHGAELPVPPQFCLMSMPEAEKLGGDMSLVGLTLITYGEEIDKETQLNNRIRLTEGGMSFAVENSVALANSRLYVYEQLSMLMPVLLGTFMLFVVSILSVNAVSITKQLRKYAIFRCCGLSWRACGLIAAEKALMTSLLSLLLCVLFFLMKPHVSYLQNLLIAVDVPQLLTMLGIFILNLLISIGIAISILRKSEPNQLLKSN